MMIVPPGPFPLYVVPLYVGPDQLLPLTSALGAVTGFLLIFWHRLRALGQKFFQMITRRERTKTGAGTGEEGGA